MLHPYTVQTRVADAVGHLRVDRADRGNAFVQPMLTDLVEAAERLAADRSVCAISLSMAGRHFCTGWDTAEFAGLADQDTTAVIGQLRDSDAALRRLHDLTVPIVAAVRGQVTGFGLGLLAAVTIPVLADTATGSLPEVNHGICPAGVLNTLRRRIPPPAVRLLAETGLPVGADDLARWGLAARVVPESDLATATATLLDATASHNPHVVRLVHHASAATNTDEDLAYHAAAATLRGAAESFLQEVPR